MTKGTMTTNGAAFVQAMELVAKHPGMTSEQVAKGIGCGLNHAKKILVFAAKQHLVGVVPLDTNGGRARGWYAAADFPAARDAWRETAEHRAAQRKESRLHTLVAKRSDPPLPWGVNPVQRKVAAGSKRPLPFRVRAVNSVFALGEKAVAA